MSKFAASLAIATALLSASAFAETAKPTVVLVHGAFADSSSWNDVTRILQKDGYNVVAAANPLRSVSTDAAYVSSVVNNIKGQYDCIHEFSEVDYTRDLQQIDRPTLIIHGDDDQIVPIKASAHRAAEIVANATLKIYAGGSHGLAETEADRFNADVLGFIRG